MIAAKESPYPMSAASLPLAEPAENPAGQGAASTESEDRPESAAEEERKS